MSIAEQQPIAIVFSRAEGESITRCWHLLDAITVLSGITKIVEAYKSRLTDRVMDIILFEILGQCSSDLKEDARQRLEQICREIEGKYTKKG